MSSENFDKFLKKQAKDLVNGMQKNGDPYGEFRPIHEALFENPEAVMDQVADLTRKPDIDQDVLDSFIVKLSRLMQIKDKYEIKEMDDLSNDFKDNQEAKQILFELNQVEYKPILDALKKN